MELVVRTGGRADGGRLHEEEEKSGGSGSDDRCGESHLVEDGVRSSGAEVEAMVNCEEERSKLMTCASVLYVGPFPGANDLAGWGYMLGCGLCG